MQILMPDWNWGSVGIDIVDVTVDCRNFNFSCNAALLAWQTMCAKKEKKYRFKNNSDILMTGINKECSEKIC